MVFVHRYFAAMLVEQGRYCSFKRIGWPNIYTRARVLNGIFRLHVADPLEFFLQKKILYKYRFLHNS
jgi:hypothetical protein